MAVITESTFQFFGGAQKSLGADRRPANGPFRSGVSLHSHTMFSEESLDIVPRYTAKLPYVSRALRRQGAEYSARRGVEFDFARAFWTPPLSPRQAYRLEEKQVQRQFGLPALISLTDHDDIRAAALMRVLDRYTKIPLSTEWTVPFGATFFHLGLHNIPADQSVAIQAELTQFTVDPVPENLKGILDRLNSVPDLLVVVNHPLWDEKRIGADGHKQTLHALLSEYGAQLHALEVNGLRSWKENLEVIALGRSLGMPVVSGGDRHGREPNAILNLTGATTFQGFVEEVRYARKSHVVFMPQYREPLRGRLLQTIGDVVRYYPENVTGRRLWSDRIFYRDPLTGETIPVSVIWQDGGPPVVKHFLRAMQLVRWRGVRSALRIASEDRSGNWFDPGVSI